METGVQGIGVRRQDGGTGGRSGVAYGPAGLERLNLRIAGPKS